MDGAMGTSPKTGDLELGRKIAARREELRLSRKAGDIELRIPKLCKGSYYPPSSRPGIGSTKRSTRS